MAGLFKRRRFDLNSLERRIFLITYMVYASYYLARLNYSVAIPFISIDLQYPKFILGLVSSAFSISYAVGQFVNGHLVDSLGAKRIILLGLVLSASMSLLFGYADLFIFLVIIWGVNGYAQSTGWPSVVKIISNWFKSNIGTIGGIFGSCFLVGNMIAWPLLGYITANYGWRAAFLTPPLILILMAAILGLFVDEKPEENEQNVTTEVLKDNFRFKQILLSKRLVTISLAYMLLQFVRSGFTLWAPSYLFETWSLPFDITGYLAAVIPFGGIVGSAISGWLSDRSKKLRRQSIILLLILSLSLILPIFYHASSLSLQIGVALLFLSGFMLYAPHILIATVIPMEYKDTHGAGSVAGFIDGIGYIGSTFADPFIGWIVDAQGWNGAVTFWLASSLTATLLMGILNWGNIKNKSL